MPTYSHSRLSTFETCKLQFKYHYIDKLETAQEDTVETFLGSLCHEALEKLYKDLRYEKRSSKEELAAWFVAEWDRRWDGATIKIVHEEYTAENYKEMGVRFLNDYYVRYAPFVGGERGRTIGLETEDLLDLGDGNQYHIRIDRLTDAGDGIYEIHDYKTGAIKTQDKLEEDRQLAMYAYWVHRAFPDARRVRLIWHFLAFDKEMHVERQLGDLEALKQEVIGKIKEIESCTEFPPTKSALCDWCAYQDVCPLWKHKFATDALPPEEFPKEAGVALVNEYAELKEEEGVVKEKLDRAQEKLYAYAEQHNVQALFGSTQKATIWSKETIKLPGKNDPGAAHIAQILKEQGLYEQYSMVDGWKLADALASGAVTLVGYAPKKERIKRIYLARR